jgi:hypothetical protein
MVRGWGDGKQHRARSITRRSNVSSGIPDAGPPEGIPRNFTGHKVLAEYGAFQVRERYLVLPDGTESSHWPYIMIQLPSATHPGALEWRPVFPAGRYKRGLAHVLRRIRVFLNDQRGHIATLRDEQAQLQASLEAWESAGSRADMPAFEDKSASWVVEALRGFGAHIAWMEERYHRVEQAWRALEAQHPEIDLGPRETTRDADPELTQELVEWSQRMKWWLPSSEAERNRWSQMRAGRVVAQYGRLTVHECIDDAPTEHRTRGPWFIIGLVTPQGSEFSWIPAALGKAPIAEGSGRDDTRRAIRMWLQLLRQDMLRGRGALEETQDTALAEHISTGLLAREEQFTAIEAALRETEALPE